VLMPIEETMPMTETGCEPQGSSAAGATEPIGGASSQRSQKLAVVGGILGAIVVTDERVAIVVNERLILARETFWARRRRDVGGIFRLIRNHIIHLSQGPPTFSAICYALAGTRCGCGGMAVWAVACTRARGAIGAPGPGEMAISEAGWCGVGVMERSSG
jgi:hypothetical protein